MVVIKGLERATLKTLSTEDAAILLSDMTRYVSPHKEPHLADMIRRNSGNIRALVEAVNDNSKQGYGGLASDGSELTIQWLTPNDFHVSGDDAEPHYSSWERWVTVGRIAPFIGGTTLEEEGLIIFGFANPVSEPGAVELKIFKGTEESVVEPLVWLTHLSCCKAYDPIKAEKMSGWNFGGCTAWDQNNFFGGGTMETPIHELRQPLIVPPETTWRVDEKFQGSGCDGLQPLGFRVRTATAAWNLAF